MEFALLYGTLAFSASVGWTLVTGVGSVRVVRSDIVRGPRVLKNNVVIGIIGEIAIQVYHK